MLLSPGFKHLGTIQPPPLPDAVDGDVLGSVLFSQTVSPKFIRRGIIICFALSLLMLVAFFYALAVVSGKFPPPNKGVDILLYGPLVVWLIMGILFVQLLFRKNFTRSVQLNPDGSVSVNGRTVQNSQLVRRQVLIKDASFFKARNRPIEALCLDIKKRTIILAMKDLPKDLDAVCAMIGVPISTEVKELEIKGTL